MFKTSGNNRIKEEIGQGQFTNLGSSSLGNLDVNYDPGWDCCMYNKKGVESPTGLTKGNCKLQAAFLFLQYN